MIEILNGIHETVSFSHNSGIRLYYNEQAEDYPIHWHTAIEIILPLENTYLAKVNDLSFTLEEGDILFIFSGELHSLFAPKTGKRIILQIDFSLLNAIRGLETVIPLFQPTHLITHHHSPDVHPEIYALMLAIMEEYLGTDSLKIASITAKIIDIYVILGRKHLSSDAFFPNSNKSKQFEYTEKFLNVCDYINAHLTENLSLDDLASYSGFSKYHFSRLFKQFSNCCPYDYINKKRILCSEALLINPDFSITDVAMKSGFNSLSTFNRVFKNIKNCTPSEFKKLYGVSHEKK